MRKRILTTLALAALSTGAMAQYNSRVQLELGNFGSTEAAGGFKLYNKGYNSVGFSFSHSVYKNIGFKLSHTRWETTQEFRDGVGFPGNRGIYYDVNTGTAPLGSITGKQYYHMLELSPVYSHSLGRHEVYASAGASFAWGSNTVLVHHSSGEWDCIPYTQQFNLMHLGMVAEAGYNIHYLRCMSTGLSVAGRYYNKQFNTIALQLNIGYNFNSFK